MNVPDAKACISALSSLGFTELEAAVYASLVQASPATGYRVAQAINKPVANTYKAIESLQEKGAVITDETGNKLCRAVPPQEVLQQLESTFSRQKREAADALSRLRPAPGDDGVYALTSRSQVFERCRAMLSRPRRSRSSMSSRNRVARSASTSRPPRRAGSPRPRRCTSARSSLGWRRCGAPTPRP